MTTISFKAKDYNFLHLNKIYTSPDIWYPAKLLAGYLAKSVSVTTLVFSLDKIYTKFHYAIEIVRCSGPSVLEFPILSGFCHRYGQ